MIAMVINIPSDKLIKNLANAVSHYIFSTFNPDEPVSYSQGGVVRPVFEVLETENFEHEFSMSEKGNKYGMLIKKQEEQRWKPKGTSSNKEPVTDRPVSIILTRHFDNPLGIDDQRYYYILFRKRLSYSWSKAFNIPKYIRKAGIYLPFAVLSHIDNNKITEVSKVILILEDGKIYEVTARDLFKFFFKYHMHLIINAWGQMVTGIPLEIFEEIVKNDK